MTSNKSTDTRIVDVANHMRGTGLLVLALLVALALAGSAQAQARGPWHG